MKKDTRELVLRERFKHYVEAATDISTGDVVKFRVGPDEFKKDLEAFQALEALDSDGCHYVTELQENSAQSLQERAMQVEHVCPATGQVVVVVPIYASGGHRLRYRATEDDLIREHEAINHRLVLNDNTERKFKNSQEGLYMAFPASVLEK
eukprot:gene20579-24669_t